MRILLSMNYVSVCPVGVIGGKEDYLTYESSEKLEVGTLVEIPFGKRTKYGVVVGPADKPNFRTKPISKVFDIIPLHLIELSKWISQYYATRLSIVLQTVLPSGLQKKRRLKVQKINKVIRSTKSHKLTQAQSSTLTKIISSSAVTHLLHGVTGSGKTRIFVELAKNVLQSQKSALILVPEIALTPQLAAEFNNIHEHVVVLHSKLSESDRHRLWQQINDSDHPWVIVGPRSSLFTPLKKIGFIAIDECHEPSYSQDSQPKYSALRVARKLAELHPGCKLILASATPLISDYYIATEKNTPIHSLNKPVTKRNLRINVVDLKDRETFGNHQFFSKLLLSEMNTSIVQKKQILLFYNRRATSRSAICSSCGWTADCPNCHVPLRLHHDLNQLLCHICGYKNKIPQTCPSCKSVDITFKGIGSKKIENEISKLFPNVKMARFDSDTPSGQQLHEIYNELYSGEIQIIIGTQGVAKGLDLPHLATVGVINADIELFIPDFSSSERAFQLLTQVIGRAGRMGQDSSVIIQTLNPNHPAIEYAIKQDYLSFYNFELKERQIEHVTPFSFMLNIKTGYSSAKSAQNACNKMLTTIKKQYPGVIVRGPAPAFHERSGSTYYWQLVILSSSRNTLVKIANNLPARWQFTLDPLNLL